MKNYKKAQYSFGELLESYFDCLKHKRKTLQAMEFEFDRERNLYKLHNEILDGSYQIGQSICFVVKEPKPREVWAGAFRDRIVHHLIYRAIYDRFVSKFIYDSYSCIAGKGTLRGVLRAQMFARNITQNYSKDAYFIKMDVKNYFVSINKNILYNLIMKHVDIDEERWLADLITKVVFHDPRKNVYVKSPKYIRDKLPPHKSLFNTSELLGLPIGNLTSQFFSNIYMNPLDQYVKHDLKCKFYIRYVDDILIIDKDPSFLNWAYAKINRFLIENLELELNHKKKNINMLSHGFDFLGFVVKPGRMYARKRTVNKCLKIIDYWSKSENKESKEELEELRNKVNSYFGIFKYTAGYNLRKNISEGISSNLIVPRDDYAKLMIL